MSKIDNMTLGERVKLVRKAAKLSQKKLAEKAGISPNTLYCLETRGNIPNFFTMMLLADVLDVSLDWLAGRKGRFDGEI